jgi:hypothetical protein
VEVREGEGEGEGGERNNILNYYLLGLKTCTTKHNCGVFYRSSQVVNFFMKELIEFVMVNDSNYNENLCVIENCAKEMCDCIPLSSFFPSLVSSTSSTYCHLFIYISTEVGHTQIQMHAPTWCPVPPILFRKRTVVPGPKKTNPCNST